MRMSVLPVLAVAALAVGGCSVGTTAKVSGTEVAKQVSDRLEEQVGVKPDKVTCPDLEAKKGAKVRCKLKAGTENYGVTVQVTGVKDKRADFTIRVDEQPS